MNKTQQILSEITVFNKYSRYLEEKQRRETWSEICDRYENMMSNKYPQLKFQIADHMELVRDKKILPSMRAMQFAGRAIEKNNSRIYNCAYLPIDDINAFSEIMFLLLGGTGVGYSVQFHHIDKLPEIHKPNKERKFLIGDSLEGWADAIKAIVKSYFGLSRYKPRFDFSDIRPKGLRLITAGGKAPGPAPLRECLAKIEGVLEQYTDGDKLKSIDCHRILCHIANSVLSGGIRRSAMIALFSFDDKEMLECKYGNWWEKDEQFGRANNSVVLLRNKIDQKDFKELWNKIELSNSGEPGIYFTNDKDWGTNPCCEIALRPFQFCNLCEINVSDVKDQDDLNGRCISASFFGTLQAGFTDFHYLRPIWRQTTEKESLVGVGMTGIASNFVKELSLKEASECVKSTNILISKLIKINNAARTTTIKPSGTSSCVLGTSSGIHAWHSKYYLRRIRIMKNDSLYIYLSINHPELIEDDKMRSYDTSIITIPQETPINSILRNESSLDLLERVKKFNLEWIKNGHLRGTNTNNVSATVSVKKEEWNIVGEWMWNNRNIFNGLSVLPYDNGSYIQAPFEEITKEEFIKLESKLSNIDLSKVIEISDNTDLQGELACSGGACEIK